MTMKAECEVNYDALLISARDDPVSAKAWHQESRMTVRYDLWMIYVNVTASSDKVGSWPYEVDVQCEPIGPRDGNVWINDIVISARQDSGANQKDPTQS